MVYVIKQPARCSRCYYKTESLRRIRRNVFMCLPCVKARLAGHEACRHCAIRRVDRKRLGLCGVCYEDKALRDKYRPPPKPVKPPRAKAPPKPERAIPATPERAVPAACEAVAGSLEKVAVLVARVAGNELLYSPRDVFCRREPPPELERVIIRELQRYEQARRRKRDALMNDGRERRYPGYQESA